MQVQEMIQFVSAHPILSIAWIVLFVAVVSITLKNRFSKINEVTRNEMTHLINKEGAVIVDTRTHEDFRRGHIAHSVNLTPSDLKNGSLGELSKNYAQPIIVVCANGLTSRASGEHLMKAGFERIYTLKGGISGWSTDNLPLARGK